jgi:hypothetical protein
MVPLAGKRLYLEPFETKQFVARGVWPEAQLVAQIRAGVIPLIVVYQPGYRERWTEAQLQAIGEATRRLWSSVVQGSSSLVATRRGTALPPFRLRRVAKAARNSL